MCPKFARHNDAFWLTISIVFTENNGKCSGLVQMVSIFGAKINKNKMQINIINDHSQGQKIQNEATYFMSNKVKKENIHKV